MLAGVFCAISGTDQLICVEIESKVIPNVCLLPAHSGAFFDVFRVRGRRDGRMYAVKKSRQPFRGRADRDRALCASAHQRFAQPRQSPIHVTHLTAHLCHLMRRLFTRSRFYFEHWLRRQSSHCLGAASLAGGWPLLHANGIDAVLLARYHIMNRHV